MRIGIKENAWWNFMRNGLQGEHHWVYHLGKFETPTQKTTQKTNPKLLPTWDSQDLTQNYCLTLRCW